MNKEEICKRLMRLVAFDYMATGSRVICNPPVIDTDEDYIVYDPTEQFCQGLYGMGIDATNGEYLGPAQFVTFRVGQVNFIVTHDYPFYKKFCKATKEATSLNLTNKQDRINLFQKILYGTPEFGEIPL